MTDIASDNESCISVDLCESEREDDSITSVQERNQSSQVETPRTPPLPSYQTAPPKRGRSRGELFQNLSQTLLVKKVVSHSPQVMIARTSEISEDQFEDHPSELTPPPRTPEPKPTKNVKLTAPQQVTPSPVPSASKRGVGRGEMLRNLMNNYSPMNNRRSSEDSDFESQTSSSVVSNCSLSSDIVELTPPRKDLQNVSTHSPEPINILDTTSTENTPEVINISDTVSTENQTPQIIDITNTASIEDLPSEVIELSDTDAESLPTDTATVSKSLPHETQQEVLPLEKSNNIKYDEQCAFQETLVDKILTVGCEGDCYFQPQFHLKDHNINVEIREVI